MSILADLQSLIEPLNISVETGVFTEKAPDCYIVLVPLTDRFELYADNGPGSQVQEVRISLFSRGNYMVKRRMVVRALLKADFTITDMHYNGYETESGYFHYVIDVAQNYGLED